MSEIDKINANKNLILRYAAALNITEGPTQTNEIMRGFTDNESYIRSVCAFRAVFPDYHIFIDDITGDDDFIYLHGLFKGTHKGEYLGIPATFRKVEVPVMVKYYLVNEKIIEAWPMFDQMELFEQLGAMKKTN